MATYAQLKKKYSEGPSAAEKFREQYGGPIIEQSSGAAPAAQSQPAAVRGDRALTDLIAGLLPKPTTQAEAKPKRDAAAYEQAKQEARQKKAEEGYNKKLLQEASDRMTYDLSVKRIEGLSDEEKRQLGEYVANRTQQQVNLLMGDQRLPTYSRNPLVDKYGEAQVRQWAETYERQQNEKNAQMIKEASEGRTGLGANVLSVGANLLGGLTSTTGRAMEMANRTGQYQTLQEHTAGDALNIFAGTVRQETAEKIAGDEYDESGNQTKEGGAIRQGLSIGYQGVMSAADSIARAVFGGGGAGTLALAATGSFSQTVSEASRQGATPAQAMILGIGTAAIEAATEKKPLKNMLDAAKGNIKGAKAIAKEALRQAGIEAGEEEISLFGNLLWEAAWLQDKSSYKQAIGEAIANGMTYDEAKAQANMAVWEEALNTAAVSAVAGGISGGGSAFVGNLAGGGAQQGVQAEPAAEVQTPVQTEQAAQTAPEAEPKSYWERIAEDFARRVVGKDAQEQVEQNAQNNTAVSDGGESGHPDYVNKKSGSIATPEPVQADSFTSETSGGTAPKAESTPAGESPETGSLATPIDSASDAIISEGNPEVNGTGATKRPSGLYENTFQNATAKDVRNIGKNVLSSDSSIGQYTPVTESESLRNAENRTATPEAVEFEYNNLLQKTGWSSEDNDTAFAIMRQLQNAGDSDRLTEIARKQKTEATTAGQLAQSFAKYSRELTTSAAADAILEIDNFHAAEVPKTFYRRTNFKEWKKSVKQSILTIANEIDAIDNGDSEGILGIIQELAQFRKTTAWAGYSSELTRRTAQGLAKMDFDTLKSIAKTQLAMIPSDFRKRSVGEIIKAIRAENMLFTITTKFRNDAGNITNGLMDAVSDSFSGRMVDALLSKVTGQRTVANDIRYAADYIKAARDAADVAAAFVSLDIPMETQTKYSTGRTRTFTPNASTLIGRMLSAYEKQLRYALEVSDKFYEGGTSYAISKSLQGLGKKSGLTAQQIQDIAQKTGERRTFKDPGARVIDKRTGKLSENGRVLARVNTGVQRALNNLGIDGFGLGDLVQPFAAVSGEVKQVALDYSGGGMISGLSKIIGILKDAKQGVPIDPYRQRTAATDFARGMSGAGLIAVFAALSAAGAIGADEKESKWNLDSSLRWWETITNGGTIEDANKAAAWNDGDETITLDFLDPFNTQIHIGYLLSQGEDIQTALLQGGFNALLDMPVMDTFSEMADLQQTFTEISEGNMDGVYDAAGQLIGTAAGSVVPNWARQTAQVIDPYYRDTYDTNPIRKVGKEVLAAIPFASRILPQKYDELGNVRLRYDDGDWLSAAIDNLVTPWDSDTYRVNPIYQEIDRLNASTDVDLTPPRARRKITYTDTAGAKHEDYDLTSDQYETMQKVQGETTAKLLQKIFENPDYKKLTDQQKAYTISAVYEYAQEKGKRTALPDYYSTADAWIAGMKDSDLRGFIAQGSKRALNKNVENAVTAVINGWKVTDAAKKDMEQSYASYSKLTPKQQERVLEQVESNTAKYLEVRKQGATTQNYLDVVQRVGKLGSNPKAADTYETIATVRGSDSVIDALMKAYMTDYDPKAESPNTTELKYDYARQELGLTAQEYAKAYRVVTDGGKKDELMAKWKGQGYTDPECTLLWNLFKTSGSQKTDVVGWHGSK